MILQGYQLATIYSVLKWLQGMFTFVGKSNDSHRGAPGTQHHCPGFLLPTVSSQSPSLHPLPSPSLRPEKACAIDGALFSTEAQFFSTMEELDRSILHHGPEVPNPRLV